MLAKHDEHKGVHVLAVFTHGPGQIYNTKRPINSLKDLEGLKIRVGGGLVNDVAKALGTVPMLKPAPEAYELLEPGRGRRLVLPQGVGAVVQARAAASSTSPTCPAASTTSASRWSMNEAKWSQISAADQAAIEQASGEALARRAGKAWDAADAKARRRCATPRSRS